MAVVARRRKGGRVVFYAVFAHEGKRVWEKAGTDKQEALRLDKRRCREVAAGKYAAPVNPGMTFGTYAETWLSRRTNRSRKAEESSMRRYVLPRLWLAKEAMSELRPRHVIRLVEELKVTVSEATGERLEHKTISNIIGVLSTLFRDALIEELVTANVAVLPKGILRRSARRDTRKPYEPHEVIALVTSPAVSLPGRMFAALAIFTGMREGEVCGRRWRDWDPSSVPLGCLKVETQYNDQPLKTEWGNKGSHPRRVPVHPSLATLLTWWQQTGFAFVHDRAPGEGDFIVPHRRRGTGATKGHTKATAYNLFVQSCKEAGVTNRTLHSTRHTFLTLAHRGGASKAVAEKVTHNAKGDIVDQYTHRDWEELCRAVLCLTEPLLLTRRLTQEKEVMDSKHLLLSAPGGEPRTIVPIGSFPGDKREYPQRGVGPSIPGDRRRRPPTAPHVPPAWVHEATANLYELRGAQRGQLSLFGERSAEGRA
jgi:integrase